MPVPRTWALVANGVRARVLRGLEAGDTELPVELIGKASSPHLRDILSDKSGRSFASIADGRRSAMEPGSDPIHRDMQDFAREMLGLLERHHAARDFQFLAVVAAPKMLGILRQEFPAGLRESVVLERSANLVRFSPAELRDTIREMLKAPQEL